MASQSIKQQIYQSIANSQVQQVMAQKREQEIAQLQASFDAWNKQQDEIANLQAQYDSWLKEQPQAQPVQQATVNEVKEIPKLRNQIDLEDFFTPKTASGENINKRKPTEEDLARAKVADIANRISNNIVPDEEQFNVKKNIKEGKTGKRSQAYKESVKDVVNALNSPEMKQTNALADYNKKAQADQWLSPDYKLSDEEKEKAREYAQAELQKYDYNSSKKPILKSDTDKQHYADMVNLLNKTNSFTNAMEGYIQPAMGIGNAVRDASIALAKKTTNLGNAITDKLGITEGAVDRNNEKIAALEDFYRQNAENIKQADLNAQTQNPIGYGAGNFAGQVSLYALTNPAFDALGKVAGAGKVGSALLNQVGQNAQDLVINTIPKVNEYREGGFTPEETADIWKGIGRDARQNLYMAGAGEVAGIIKKNKAAKKASDAAFRANVREGAEKLAKLAGTDTLDEAAEAAAKQIPNMENPLGDIAKGIEGENLKVSKAKGKKNLANDLLNEYTADFENAAETIEDAAKTQLPEYGPEVQEKVLSDFDEIYRSMDNMNQAAIDSGDAKALEKFGKLQDAVFNYEETIWKNGNPEDINKAKKAADAARQGFIRQMKKIDPSYTGDLTGTKLGNAEFRIPKELSDAEADELVNGWVKEDLENPNRFVEDVSKRNQVMAEDTGLNETPDSNTLTFDYEKPVGDTGSEPLTIGEEILTPDNYKERGTSKHIRNAGTPMRMEDVAEEVAADFEKDPDMYRVLRNADTKAKAEEIYNTSDDPEAAFRALLEKKDPASLPLGHQIAKDYAAAGNHDAAAQIYRDMGKALTESGQFSQAAVINMVKNDPMTALQFAQKEVDSLNEAGRKRFGDKWADFKLTDDEIKAFDNIKPGDSDAIKAVYERIGDRLGKDYPTTLMEKLVEARRVAMLFNPRTNVRNVFANPPTLGMRWVSDRVEALGQNAAHIINPDIKVTQSLYGSGIKGRKLANEAWKSNQVQALVKGSGSKADIPELGTSVMQHKQVFKGNALEKWIDKVTHNSIQRVNEKLFGVKGVTSFLETLRNMTYKLLDLGDKPFVKENFVERLGSYIAATGIKNVDDIPEEAIEMAWEEAMKATYKDNSTFVKGLKQIKTGTKNIGNNIAPGFGDILSQSAIPFLQAPANIAQRMIDYSAVGATKGLAKIVSGAKSGNVKSIEKGIEEAAKGLTGTGLVLLGMRLRESGVLTGTYSDDKKQKAFQKMNGFKEFAIHAGDQYFTYGWAQPFAQELMVGTLLADAIAKSDEYDSDILRYFGMEGSDAGKAIGVAREGTKSAVNSWFNESPIAGLTDFFKGNSYSDTDIATNLWENGVEDFASSMIPAVVNATAKTVDPVQRNTYNPDNAFASFINSNVAKLPYASKTLPAKYDTWGREMKYAESKGAAAASRYAIPGEYSYDKGDEIDNEIQRLFNEAKDADGKLLQDNGVFPTVAPNKVGEKTLNNKEVSEYQQDMGQRSRAAVESFINSDAYKSMEDPEKIEVIKNIYGASGAITKRDKFDTPLADNSTYKKAIAAYDEAGGGEAGAKAMAEYYSNKKVADESGLSSQSKAYEEIQKDLAKGDTEAAQQKIDAATRLPELGLDNPYVTATYYKAQTQYPNITPEDFAKTYKAIDKDGNQALKKNDEVIPYMNSQKMSYNEGMKFWKAYAKTEGKSAWKLPKLEDGVWK